MAKFVSSHVNPLNQNMAGVDVAATAAPRSESEWELGKNKPNIIGVCVEVLSCWIRWYQPPPATRYFAITLYDDDPSLTTVPAPPPVVESKRDMGDEFRFCRVVAGGIRPLPICKATINGRNNDRRNIITSFFFARAWKLTAINDAWWMQFQVWLTQPLRSIESEIQTVSKCVMVDSEDWISGVGSILPLWRHQKGTCAALEFGTFAELRTKVELIVPNQFPRCNSLVPQGPPRTARTQLHRGEIVKYCITRKTSNIIFI